MESNKTTNAILAIITICLVGVIIIFFPTKPKSVIPIIVDQIPTTQTNNSSPTTPVVTTTEPIHPPAPGPFIANAVTNFHSTYNPGNRTFTITATVASSMFIFESNAVASLYDNQAHLVQQQGMMPAGNYDLYSPNRPATVPVNFTMTLPANVDPHQQFIFRIVQDDPSGNGNTGYWGTVISGN